MPQYIYNDEDNVAMCPELFDLPFDEEPEEPTADELEDELNDHA